MYSLQHICHTDPSPVLYQSPGDHDLLQILLIVPGHADVLQCVALVVILDLWRNTAGWQTLYILFNIRLLTALQQNQRKIVCDAAQREFRTLSEVLPVLVWSERSVVRDRMRTCSGMPCVTARWVQSAYNCCACYAGCLCGRDSFLEKMYKDII